MKVLDLGCGAWEGSDPFKGQNVIHFDILKTEWNRVILEVQGDGHQLPFRDKTFDVVTAYHVLEHCHTPLQVLEEIRRVAKKRVVLKVPSLKAAMNQEDHRHLYTWSKSSFTHFCKRVFHDVKLYETNGVRCLKWLQKMPFFQRTFNSLMSMLFKTELTAICELKDGR